MDEELIRRWIRPEIQALSAYHVADAGSMIKLDAMENPYVWPQDLRQQWADRISSLDVNRYPHPQAPALAHRLRQTMAIPESMGVLLGNGSDEIIQMIALALAKPGRTLLSVEPAFVMYQMIARFCGMEYVGVPLDPVDYSLDMPALLEAIEQTDPAVIFLAYPNNPTGNLFAENEMVQIIKAAPGLVVVDEAYAPFTEHSFMPLLGQFDNLVVMRTVSKMGLAGLRLGLLAGPAAWINEFDKIRMPYNINVLTQFSAEFALQHQPVFDEQTALIRRERSLMSNALTDLPGLEVFPSQANFILVRVKQGSAEKIFVQLKDRGILVKLLHGSHPLVQNCLRLTIGTPDENSSLLAALSDILSPRS